MEIITESIGYKVEDRVVAQFMNNVYLWMVFGIFVTAIFAHLTANFFLPSFISWLRVDMYLSPLYTYIIYPLDLTAEDVFKCVFYGSILLQLILVIGLTATIDKISYKIAIVLYVFYAASVGLMFSLIFLSYTKADITTALMITAVAFFGLSAFGYITKRNLKFLGTFCTMGLNGLIAILVYGLFVPSFMTNTVQLQTAIVGIVVFSGLTAYDTQRIKNYAFKNPDHSSNKSIICALLLYLDFINLFLSILRSRK